jgi:hypothetical protein
MVELIVIIYLRGVFILVFIQVTNRKQFAQLNFRQIWSIFGSK